MMLNKWKHKKRFPHQWDAKSILPEHLNLKRDNIICLNIRTEMPTNFSIYSDVRAHKHNGCYLFGSHMQELLMWWLTLQHIPISNCLALVVICSWCVFQKHLSCCSCSLPPLLFGHPMCALSWSSCKLCAVYNAIQKQSSQISDSSSRCAHGLWYERARCISESIFVWNHQFLRNNGDYNDGKNVESDLVSSVVFCLPEKPPLQFQSKETVGNVSVQANPSRRVLCKPGRAATAPSPYHHCLERLAQAILAAVLRYVGFIQACFQSSSQYAELGRVLCHRASVRVKFIVNVGVAFEFCKSQLFFKFQVFQYHPINRSLPLPPGICDELLSHTTKTLVIA